MLIANSNLVPHWATWEKFRELEKAGLMMYGQMTAGSWIYIGTQGILQGTYETFASAARVHYGAGADLQAARFVVSGGPRRHGRRAAARRDHGGGVFLGIDVDPTRIQRRLETRYLDERRAISTTRSRAASAPRRRGARCRSGSRATARASCPSWCAAASCPTS